MSRYNLQGERFCPACKVYRSLTFFWKGGNRDGYCHYCKDCWKSIRRKYYSRNKEYAFLNYRKNLFKKYGISNEEFEKMSDQQNGKCSICLQPNANGKKLSVDHCHKLGKVRGLICNRCNLGIGNFRDSIGILKKAIEYLEKCQ